ncbi:MAG: acetyltransferase [Bacteroidia bacterium]
MREAYILYGGGGQGAVVAAALQVSGKEIIGYVDDKGATRYLSHIPFLGKYEPHLYPGAFVILSIGDNLTRKRLSTRVSHRWGQVIHPTAWVGPHSELGMGTMILARAVIQTGVSVGNHTIIGSGVIVEHHSKVGAFCHITTGAIIAGEVEIEDEVYIGPGAVVARGLRIGRGAVIGAQAYVHHSVPPHAKVWGVPAVPR